MTKIKKDLKNKNVLQIIFFSIKHMCAQNIKKHNYTIIRLIHILQCITLLKTLLYELNIILYAVPVIIIDSTF